MLGPKPHRTAFSLPASPATLALGLGLLFLPAAHAGWRPVGPFGGTVGELAVSPAANGPVFAVAGYAGLFRSADQAGHWDPERGAGWRGIQVLHVAADPRRAGTYYVGTDVAFDYTRDGGRTWTTSTSLPRGEGAGPLAIVVDQEHPSFVYVISGQQVFVSRDAGTSWASGELPGDTAYASTLAVDARGAVYAATHLGGLFRSRNHGRSWQSLPGLEGFQVRVLATAPNDAEVLYAGGQDGLRRSLDGGARWQDVTAGLPSRGVTAVAVHPGRARELYVALQTFTVGEVGGVFHSRDAGAHWQRVTGGLPALDATALAIDRRDPRRIYAGLEREGIFRSRDGGRSWQPVNQGLRTLIVTHLARDPRNETVLYTGPTGDGVLRSLDGGGSWRVVNSRLNGLYGAESLALDTANPDTVYAGIPGRLERSDDRGRTWHLADRGLRHFHPSGTVVLDPSDSQTLYAATESGVFVSHDGARSWRATSASGCPGLAYRLAISPVDSQDLFASSPYTTERCADRGFYSSTNGGADWVQRGAYRPALVPDPFESGVIYSIDGGSHFSASIDGGRHFTVGSMYLTALGADPVVPDLLYGAWLGQVLTSDDRGAHWNALGEPLDGDALEVLPDPVVAGRIWAATTHAVFVYDP